MINSTSNMFNTKQNSLFTVKKSTKATNKNAFVNEALKSSAETVSGNGAKKYSTTGNEFVDQFTKVSEYLVRRSYDNISKDCDLLWAENQLDAVKFIFFLRTICRKVRLFDGSETEKAQKGAELKHESIMRMFWLNHKSPNTFKENLPLFVSLGSWHDVFTMMQYDLVYHGWKNKVLDWDFMGKFILSGLANKNTCELVKKYLPQIKAKSDCSTVDSQANTMIAKYICSLLFGEKKEGVYTSYKNYRKLKNSGNAHDWQKLISQKKFDLIDFDKIHGKALNLLVRSKFLTNQGLSNKYASWITTTDKDVKYTGFVHELFKNVNNKLPVHEAETINKQFHTLVNKSRDNDVTSLIVVRDTSASMGSSATGTNVSCFDVAKALALFFSEFLQGEFANSFIEFNSKAKMHTWKGNTPVEKWNNDKCEYVGSTNFMSVIQLFCEMKQKGIDENDFPKGILCISDTEFDPTQLNKTNVESAREQLRNAGFSKQYADDFIIVLWNLRNTYYGSKSGTKFETFGSVPNVYYFGGFSPSTISFLTEKIKLPEELVKSALDQEVINMIELKS